MNNDIRELDIFFGNIPPRTMDSAYKLTPSKTFVTPIGSGTNMYTSPTPEYKMHEASYHDMSAWVGPTNMLSPDQEKQLKDNIKPREFSTGATRSNDNGRYDPEAFLSPIVIERYSEYMNKNRLQPDGSIRAGDNWQKGIPLAVYMKGMWRHMLHVWTRHRGFAVQDKLASANMEEDLCAIMFNVQGMLFELLKNKYEITTAAAEVQ